MTEQACHRRSAPWKDGDNGQARKGKQRRAQKQKGAERRFKKKKKKSKTVIPVRVKQGDEFQSNLNRQRET